MQHAAQTCTGSYSLPLEQFHPIYRQLLRLESDSADELLDYRVGAIPYWGLIRLVLLLRLTDRIRQDDSAGDIFLRPRPVGPARALKYVLESVYRTPFRYAPAQIVFFCAGVNQVVANGKSFNTRVDYFVNQLAGYRTLLIEGANDLRYSWPRAVAPVAFRGGLTVPAAASAKLRGRRGSEGERPRKFMQLLRRAFGATLSAGDYATIEQELLSRIAKSPVYHSLVSRLLDRLQPQLLFIENAHFGFDIEVVHAARERGMKTAEYQHGAVNPACPYHNFSPSVLAAGYARFLPDYFLSYGDFWHPLLTSSSQLIAIGNPHVAAMQARAAAVPAKPNSVYFLSSANSRDIYMDKLRELDAAGFTLRFRPHPVERPILKERYGAFFDELRIAVDLEQDFYGQLAQHEFVIGDGRSTSLFEAYAIAGRRVFVLESSEDLSQALPNHSFLPTIKSAHELRRLPCDERQDGVPVDELFAANWQARFSQFVAAALSG